MVADLFLMDRYQQKFAFITNSVNRMMYLLRAILMSTWGFCPESCGQDGENGEKTGKKRAKMGEKWLKKSRGELTFKVLLAEGIVEEGRGVALRARRIG